MARKSRFDDLEAVMLGEKARGRKAKPMELELFQQRKKVKRQMGNLLRIEDRGTFLKVLKDDYGLQARSEGYRLALKEWLEYQRTRRA